ncbi:hypothetical protein [Pelagibaculum spongiae]|uniref:Uncharacterized protein n=1 Tax=Pelagibaculum spongiae TaxID=2080658 RepID=A0A2V1GWW1_9GAMM|nr:hypothetical protein [Pelagibaculum spongiae]PVZ71584.1 hypothetical protein DC094_00645 [Pelagibaculum spongiae]
MNWLFAFFDKHPDLPQLLDQQPIYADEDLKVSYSGAVMIRDDESIWLELGRRLKTRAKKITSYEVQFQRALLLKALSWRVGPDSYTRLKSSFDKLSEARLHITSVVKGAAENETIPLLELIEMPMKGEWLVQINQQAWEILARNTDEIAKAS